MTSQIKVMMVDDEPIIRKAVKYEVNERHAMVECRTDDDGTVETKEVVVLDTFANGAQLIAALDDPMGEKPDYLLLDMELQGEPTGGIAIADRVHGRYKNSRGEELKIIIFSGRFDNPVNNEVGHQQRMLEVGKVVFEALRHGANAFVSKNAVGGFSIENVVRAIACLERGEEYYFNYPVMLTLKEAAELYIDRASDAVTDIALSPIEKQILLAEAAGCTAQEIADRTQETDKSIQEKQKDISRRLDIVNKSGARIAKALQYGLIDPKEIRFLKR